MIASFSFGNRIGDSGMSFLSEALKVNSTLTHLDLELSDQQNKKALSFDCFIMTESFGDTGFFYLSEALKINSSLMSLNLWIINSKMNFLFFIS